MQEGGGQTGWTATRAEDVEPRVKRAALIVWPALIMVAECAGGWGGWVRGRGGRGRAARRAPLGAALPPI
jgi:hypothetical protein